MPVEVSKNYGAWEHKYISGLTTGKLEKIAFEEKKYPGFLKWFWKYFNPEEHHMGMVAREILAERFGDDENQHLRILVNVEYPEKKSLLRTYLPRILK